MLNSCRVCSTRIREFTSDRSLIRAVSSYIWAVIGQSARSAIQWCNKWSLRETQRVNTDTQIKMAKHNATMELNYLTGKHSNMVLWAVQWAILWIKKMWHLYGFGGSACVPSLPRTQTNEHLEFPILPDVSGCIVDGAHEPAEVPYSCLPVFIWGHRPLLCAFKIHLWLFCQSKKRNTRGKITNSVK